MLRAKVLPVEPTRSVITPQRGWVRMMTMELIPVTMPISSADRPFSLRKTVIKGPKMALASIQKK